ncbi:hypothetical protein, partial [Acinetobacter baumannii]|uniref:hypothetical protein n=1 Tax=Acinetobacter baumannii TaxID=470 RepID=UPI001D17C9A8
MSRCPRHKRIRFEDLTRLRCSLEKAKPFIVTHDYRPQPRRAGIDGVAAAPARRFAYADGALVMCTVRFDGSFQGWRDAARVLLQEQIAPHEVNWASGGDVGLFDEPMPT